MDQHAANTDSAEKVIMKTSFWSLIPIGCLIGLLIAVPVCFVAYKLGYSHGKQTAVLNTVKTKTTKIAVKPKVTGFSEPTPDQTNPYALFYIAPSSWRSMVWQPDSTSKGTAILSPDYTSIADPNPKTGLAILIYQFPDQFKDMAQFRSSVEEVEDNLKDLTQTVVGGFPTWHAIFVSTDSERVIDDYHILKEHEHWVVRIIIPGNSLPTAQVEEQKYSYQINGLLQSIQFKTVQ